MQVTGWGDAARVIDEAHAIVCLPCNGREGPCTCADACLCRHARKAHEHHRGGTDCGLCPEGECSRYRHARRNIIFSWVIWGLGRRGVL